MDYEKINIINSLNFNEINNIIKTELDDKEVQPSLYYLDQIAKLSEIIVNNTPEIDMKEYTTKVPLNSSVQMAIDFLNTINPKYSQMFQNILRNEKIKTAQKAEYSVKFYKVDSPKKYYYNTGSNGLVGSKIPKEEGAGVVTLSGTVSLSYSESLTDVFLFVHEMTHKFSTPKDQFYMVKHFLGEVPTISMEVLLKDYLLENTEYDKDEILIYWRNRLFFYSLYSAGTVIFEQILIKLYRENNNRIDSYHIIQDYIESMDKDSKLYRLLSDNYLDYLNLIYENKSLRFHAHLRYVIGILLACDIHNKVKEDSTNKDKLSYLIDILGNTNISTNRDLQTLSKLDIPIIHDGQLRVEERDIIRLTNCYKKEILDIIGDLNYQRFHQNEIIEEVNDSSKSLFYNRLRALFVKKKNILSDYQKYDSTEDDKSKTVK